MLGAILGEVSAGPGRLGAAERSAAASEGALPPPLDALARKIRARALDVTAGDIEAAKAAGYSEDQLFELTVATALGGSARRLDAALRALGRKGS